MSLPPAVVKVGCGRRDTAGSGAQKGRHMDRRSFVRLLAGAPLVGTFQPHSEVPALKVVSRYAAAPKPGMPGSYPGRVVTVKSDKAVDTSTGKADEETVREMMARGMRTLTGSSSTAESWRRFFDPADLVG